MSAFSDAMDALRLALSNELRHARDDQRWRLYLSRVMLVQAGTVARSDTVSKLLFTLPAATEIHAIYISGPTGSNAGTAAGLDVGAVGFPQRYVNNWDVRLAAGVGLRVPTAGNLGPQGGAPTPITARYAETGTASTQGGPWTVQVLYSRV